MTTNRASHTALRLWISELNANWPSILDHFSNARVLLAVSLQHIYVGNLSSSISCILQIKCLESHNLTLHGPLSFFSERSPSL